MMVRRFEFNMQRRPIATPCGRTRYDEGTMHLPAAPQRHNLIDSAVRYGKSRNGVLNLLALATILAGVIVVSLPTVTSPDIDDLDSAHHLVDGYFFRDLIVDHPVSHLEAYALG